MLFLETIAGGVRAAAVVAVVEVMVVVGAMNEGSLLRFGESIITGVDRRAR